MVLHICNGITHFKAIALGIGIPLSNITYYSVIRLKECSTFVRSMIVLGYVILYSYVLNICLINEPIK